MNTARKALCLRILVIIFTGLIWAIGAAVFGFALWLRLDFWIKEYVTEELKQYQIAVYVAIATGGVILAFGIVGIYAAARPDRCCLVVYLIFVPVLLILIIVGGTYGFVYRSDLIESVKNSQLLVEIVQKEYGVRPEVTNAFDYIQWELKCCGGGSFTDYTDSAWSLSDPRHEEKRKGMAPLSCCSNYYQYKDIPSEDNYCRIHIPGREDETIPTNNENLQQTGCGEAIVNFVRDNVEVVAIIAFCIVVVLVIIIVCVSMLLYYLRRVPRPQEDDVVYEMARTQEKSPYPTRGGPYANLYQS